MTVALPRETETKFRVDDRARLEARLRSLGAADQGTDEESNLLFDDPGGRLGSKGCALRVRWTGGAGLLTFKGKAEVLKGVKSRPEYESAVADPRAVAQVLAALGFSPWFRYEKRRAAWRFGDPDRPVVVIDETPIGLFAEIEGNEDAVRALAAELEVPESAFIAESYVALYLAARERNPALPKDMIFGAT
jgi:adenylate cyclase, class 2